MSTKSLLILMASALLALSAGCDRRTEPKTVDRDAEESCLEEGFDPGTTEYVNCIEELSGGG